MAGCERLEKKASNRQKKRNHPHIKILTSLILTRTKLIAGSFIKVPRHQPPFSLLPGRQTRPTRSPTYKQHN